MKAVLEFNLDEEKESFEMAVNAGKYYSALIEIRDYLRKLDKYGLPEDYKKLSRDEIVTKIRQEVFEITSDLDI